MARWKTKPAPMQPASEQQPRRSVMMTERTRGLAALPTSEHAAFLAEFYERYPMYPQQSLTCRCDRCAGVRHG